ncbi:hypothetical protein [Sphingorhabdus sp.]|uniref:hypothetical protein n=1 Tax=Sphingorhabdus sp. TaxID=1902408 RepID=UPI0037C8E7D5
MATEEMGKLLNQIGQHLADILDQHPDGSYMYAEVTEGSCEAGVFHDEGEQVVYYEPNDELFDALFDLWKFAEADKKWTALHYEVNDGAFKARFLYPDQLDPDEFSYERRGRALDERYGDKPVIYPESDGDFRELTLDDFPDDDENSAT